jgi:hypothetical protein
MQTARAARCCHLSEALHAFFLPLVILCTESYVLKALLSVLSNSALPRD